MSNGNPARGESGWSDHVQKLGKRVVAVSKYIEKNYDEGLRVKALRFQVRYATDGDVLVVITVDRDGAHEVAFASGSDFEDALSTLGGMMLNGKLRFREDEYGKPKTSN